MNSGYVLTSLEKAIRWAQQGSLSFLTADLACCGIEMLQVSGSRFDIERFGATEQTSPKNADLLVVAGTLTYKNSTDLLRLYGEMNAPKFVMALGGCAISGGPFHSGVSYSCVDGVEKLFKVDVHVPGCPPRPEAILQGLIYLQEKIKTA